MNIRALLPTGFRAGAGPLAVDADFTTAVVLRSVPGVLEASMAAEAGAFTAADSPTVAGPAAVAGMVGEAAEAAAGEDMAVAVAEEEAVAGIVSKRLKRAGKSIQY